MEKGTYARYGAATGILAVVLVAVGFLVFSTDIPDAEHDVLAHALNEEFMDRGGDHPMPYRHDLPITRS